MTRFATETAACLAVLGVGLFFGCRSTDSWRTQADDVATRNLVAAQRTLLATNEEIRIESPADTLRRRLLRGQKLATADMASFGIRDLPTNRYWSVGERLKPGATNEVAALVCGTNTLEIGFADAVRIAAHNSPEFQGYKEDLYCAALALDLEDSAFRSTFTGLLNGNADTWQDDAEDRTGSHEENGQLGVSRKFSNGMKVTGSIAVNLAGMLSGDTATAWGSFADLSVSIPLMRGSGKLVNLESLTQSQRDLVYAVRTFEQRKRVFAVSIEEAYLDILLSKRKRQNAEENYRRVVLSTQRSRRLMDASRLSHADFDQTYQSELSSRASWISACQSYESALDSFKVTLGLPPDARIRPRDADLADLEKAVAHFASAPVVMAPPDSVDVGKMKVETDKAVATAFAQRADFITYRDRIEDAQRKLLVAEDALRAEVTLGGKANALEKATAYTGRTGKNARFAPKDWSGNAFLNIDLPFDSTRVSERNAYRTALIAVEEAVRTYQSQEDALKRTIRSDMRGLSQTREQLSIQFRAVTLAERRVQHQNLLLQRGDVNMTVFLDSQSALLSAQDSLYSAITAYRTKELALQRDTGMLDVTAEGVWKERK